MRTIRDEDAPRTSYEPVTIPDVKALRETKLALLCLVRGKELWVPQSQIHDDSEVYEVGGEGKLVVKGWWAAKEGLASE